jgi:hypothetical protein
MTPHTHIGRAKFLRIHRNRFGYFFIYNSGVRQSHKSHTINSPLNDQKCIHLHLYIDGFHFGFQVDGGYKAR